MRVCSANAGEKINEDSQGWHFMWDAKGGGKNPVDEIGSHFTFSLPLSLFK